MKTIVKFLVIGGLGGVAIAVPLIRSTHTDPRLRAGAELMATLSSSSIAPDGSVQIQIKNIGPDKELRYTISSNARWLKSKATGHTLFEIPIGNSRDEHGLASGQSAAFDLIPDTGGLGAGDYQATLTVTSNGGGKALELKLTTTKANLNGTWFGGLERPNPWKVSPAVGLVVTQTGENVSAHIDGLRSPAFATKMLRQALKNEFIAGQGSDALGQLIVNSVGEAPSERIVATAQANGQFLVEGSLTGNLGHAAVGQLFDAMNPAQLTFTIQPSANGRPYRAGDVFKLTLAKAGAAPDPISGTLSGGIQGTMGLDPAFLGVPQGCQRTIRLINLRIVSPYNLVADFTMTQTGLLVGREVKTEGTLKLMYEQ